jgi:hypothetical protein
MNYDTLKKLLDAYCDHFPFQRVDEALIDRLAENWGFPLPELLRKVYQTIGTGDYWMTGQYCC